MKGILIISTCLAICAGGYMYLNRDCKGLTSAMCSYATVSSERNNTPMYNEVRRYQKYGAISQPTKHWYSDLEVMKIIREANNLRKEVL